MRWSERQRAMLREMGIPLWSREVPVGDDVAGGPAGKAGAATPAADAGPASGALERVGPPDAAPGRSSPAATLAAAPGAALADAEWLVVTDPFLAADASAADQERLLDNMLAAIGVSRSAPARAGRAALVGLAEPGSGAGQAATAWLDAAIDAVRPDCILALGRGAAQAVLDTDEPLGALRGRREARAGVPVIVTFAPAFLLRHPAEKAKAWADLCLAVRCVDEAA